MSINEISWAEEVGSLMERIKDAFRSKSGETNARKYFIGLLSGAERKNGWQLAESVGEKTSYALQQFLY